VAPYCNVLCCDVCAVLYFALLCPHQPHPSSDIHINDSRWTRRSQVRLATGEPLQVRRTIKPVQNSVVQHCVSSVALSPFPSPPIADICPPIPLLICRALLCRFHPLISPSIPSPYLFSSSSYSVLLPFLSFPFLRSPNLPSLVSPTLLSVSQAVMRH
jgi:hypothetical protein